MHTHAVLLQAISEALKRRNRDCLFGRFDIVKTHFAIFHLKQIYCLLFMLKKFFFSEEFCLTFVENNSFCRDILVLQYLGAPKTTVNVQNDPQV